MIRIKLVDIINELELICDEGNSFIDKINGRLFHIDNKDLKYVIDETNNDNYIPVWLTDNIRVAADIVKSGSYIQLPSKDEINECGLMLKYCLSFSDKKIHDEVNVLMKYENDFYQKLKDIISKYCMGRDWYKYKRKQFRKIAVDWCRKNNIEFY